MRKTWSDFSGSKFMNAADCADAKVVTIKAIRQEKMPDGSIKACAVFDETDKLVVLNATRRKFLEQRSKSRFVDDAVGVKLLLTQGTTQFGGEDRACIKFAMVPADVKKQIADELGDSID